MKGLLGVGGRLRYAVQDDDESGNPIISHLGQVLQVRHLSVLMGSGASFHLGSPQIRNLGNDRIVELVEATGATLDEAEQRALKAVNPDDDGDLEALLTTLQSALGFGSATRAEAIHIAGCEHEIKVLRSLRLKLNRSLAEQCRLPRDGFPRSGREPLAAHETFFSRLLRARRGDLPRPRVFTTNYDLVIERSLDALGVPYMDGFSGTVEKRLNLETYNYDIYRTHSATQDVVGRVASALHLYKLHGSLNWRFKTGRWNAGTVTIADESATADLEELALIYPTPAKERDTLAFPYSDLFRLFANTLQVPDTALVSIGYGFADEHLNRIILGALASNQSLSVLLVDPVALYGDPAKLEPLTPARDVALDDIGVPLQDSRLAALAKLQDSRISVITGGIGAFEAFADLMPDPHQGQPDVDGPTLARQLELTAAALGLQP